MRQSIEQLAGDIDCKPSRPILGGERFGATFGFDLGFGDGAKLVGLGLGLCEKRGFRGRRLGLGGLQGLAAVLDKVGSFRRCLLALALRRGLGGLRVGEQLSGRLLPPGDGVDHRTEQKVRQQPD